MARKVEVTLVDDLDGGEAEETVAFGLDGTRYEIDLSSSNAEKLRDTLAKFIDAARRDKGGRQPVRAVARKAVAGPNTSDVREWAKAQGYEVSERGRVANDLIVKFQEANT
ncbi:MAG TPA: Lsr2 family protein [Actinocrinis sp.]|uniref:histone-like nucleoid-structuring protein Lsr2 n=1 Tax=Actinocrinis sp. TaxID=1920516 RepID=UPI002DDCB04D|nr:Lsr2 family protein [Actinocrinis sp.]HEV2347863.1 Lsr2 family protein [Actinocrinis sp.]